MPVKCNDAFLKDFVSQEDIQGLLPKLQIAHKKIVDMTGEGSEFLGWYNLPDNYDKNEFERIKQAAKKIQNSCDVFVVIGIGGSYLGARSAIEFIKSNNYNLLCKNTPQIFFVGNSISPSALSEVLLLCEGKDVCVNVISKSGTTTEPAVAFRIFRKLLEEKYGKENSKQRIFVTTDKQKGTLKEFSDDIGYETFVIPDNVGGRYSVLTACGLLPIAVSGCNIDEIMLGAKKAFCELSECDVENNSAYKYALLRNVLYNQGKGIEVMACYEPSYQYMAEWWKQLFGESEGKDGKGLFPASVIYSTDLHSLGQYIQQGRRNVFETVVNIKEQNNSVIIPDDSANIDNINFLSGQQLDTVNKKAYLATLIAHSDGNVPNIVLEVDSRKEYDYGYLVYFFELACAVSGYILGVNPFDQPGVEEYKKNMFALLGKPGKENQTRRKELEDKLNLSK